MYVNIREAEMMGWNNNTWMINDWKINNTWKIRRLKRKKEEKHRKKKTKTHQLIENLLIILININ